MRSIDSLGPAGIPNVLKSFLIDGILLIGWVIGYFSNPLSVAEDPGLQPLLAPVAVAYWNGCGFGMAHCTVDVLFMEAPESRLFIADGTLDPEGLPYVIGGKQVTSLGEFRALLREYANPLVYRDLEREAIAPNAYWSSVPLLVRCDYRQDFQWLQLLFNLVRKMPNETWEDAIAESPLIHRVTVAGRQDESLWDYL